MHRTEPASALVNLVTGLVQSPQLQSQMWLKLELPSHQKPYEDNRDGLTVLWVRGECERMFGNSLHDIKHTLKHIRTHTH